MATTPDRPKVPVTPLVIRAGEVALNGDLAVPPAATGIVVFAHGSGSGRRSPRNQHVAEQLAADGFATLLFDLLTLQEEEAERSTRHLRFDIPLLADRLTDVLAWIGAQRALAALPIGLFGASTGAAAALIAATRVRAVRAVVSRGGRPDLADAALPAVTCPTLLIVGGNDHEVLLLNKLALRQIPATARLQVVPYAGHLFEEPGALDEVTRAASAWFREHLIAARPLERPGRPLWHH